MGIVLYRRHHGELEVLLAHMGGPLWARKDYGAWTIPKGEPVEGEMPFATAKREFEEELGLPLPVSPPRELGSVRQSGGKTVTAWAIEGDVDPGEVRPGQFTMEWPRHSGIHRSFPEVDRVAWFGAADASARMVIAQRSFLGRLQEMLKA